MSDFTSNIGEWSKKIWAPVAFIIGAVLLIYQFVQIWRGDQTTTWITTIVLYLALVISLVLVAFSKEDSPIQLETETKRRIPRYPKVYKPARWGIAVMALLPILTAAYLLFIHKNCNQKEKIVILVANFDGPEPKSYRVTDKIIAQLRESLAEYNDTVILPLGKAINENESISEEEGSQQAQEIGKRHCATLVLWGWYGVTGTDVLLTIHAESLNLPKYLPLPNNKFYSAQATFADLQSFKFQERLSKEMSSFTLFISGFVRYEAKDYNEAVERLSAALNTNKWPEDLLPKALLFFYRGIAHMMSERYQEAITDLSQAIQINPKYAEAFNVRAATYFKMSDMSRAIIDYSKAIELNPEGANYYHNRCLAYLLSNKYQEAIEDANKAIELGSKDSLDIVAYETRGQASLALGNTDSAIEDFSKVIQSGHNDSNLFFRRGVAHSITGNYTSAVADLSKAIEINPSDSFYFSTRGDAYLNLNEYDKALSDFNKAIEINPQDPLAYYSRSNVDRKLERDDETIADLRKALEIIDNPDFSFQQLAHSPMASIDKAEFRNLLLKVIPLAEEIKQLKGKASQLEKQAQELEFK